MTKYPLVTLCTCLNLEGLILNMERSPEDQPIPRPPAPPPPPHYGVQLPPATAPETERMQLRMFAPDDLDALALIFSNPEVMRYLGDGQPLPRAEAERALLSIIKHWESNGFGRWAVVHKEDNRLIGYCGIRSLYGVAELVYLLDQPYWGAGLATELAQACLRFGFFEQNFDPILAVVKPPNIASRHVLEKIGMRFDKFTSYYDIEVVQYILSRADYGLEPAG